eukprot:TRINITY_DN12610_c0_g1_i4.p1 TRINITY_DN12610_c0_g1~~TRINITY_DN12610_c0_g1_i4.p1  ORF type:complete len:609 (+),score=112.64 TRINITY_DN12610_c0_g1_i4:376-2202(+)
MNTLEAVTEAVALVRKDQDDLPELVVYLSPKNLNREVDLLISTLPEHMRPHQVVYLNIWPRTTSGKVDRWKLPAPAEVEAWERKYKANKPVKRRWLFPETAKGPSITKPVSVNKTQAVAVSRVPTPAELASQFWRDNAVPTEMVRWTTANAFRLGLVLLEQGMPMTARAVPLTLLPMPVSRRKVEPLQALAPVFNRLYDKVSCHLDWLVEKLSRACDTDIWLARLIEIAKLVQQADRDPEPCRLLLFRQDYLEASTSKYLQVEVNTMAVAHAGMSEQCSKLHASAMTRLLPALPDPPTNLNQAIGNLQANRPANNFARALSVAHKAYLAAAPDSCKAKVCFLCFEDDTLETDQNHVAALLSDLQVESIRAGLSSDHWRLERESATRQSLWLDRQEISVVYFHTGYTPEVYKTELEWNTRQIIEMSCAVKAPTIPMQLAGCKLIQQVLSSPTELRRFISEEEVQQVCSVFARQFNPAADDQVSRDARSEARVDPDRWVMKPQREGGGHCVFGEALAQLLAHSSETELAGWVLMERMRGACVESATLANGTAELCHQAIGEIGVFSSMVIRGEETLLNSVGGCMVRTKCVESNEGGVCCGAGCIDSCLLI